MLRPALDLAVVVVPILGQRLRHAHWTSPGADNPESKARLADSRAESEPTQLGEDRLSREAPVNRKSWPAIVSRFLVGSSAQVMYRPSVRRARVRALDLR